MLLQTYHNKQNTKRNIIWFHFSVLFSGKKIYVDVKTHFDFSNKILMAKKIKITFQINDRCMKSKHSPQDEIIVYPRFLYHYACFLNQVKRLTF